jgi:hypothetical protein
VQPPSWAPHHCSRHYVHVCTCRKQEYALTSLSPSAWPSRQNLDIPPKPYMGLVARSWEEAPTGVCVCVCVSQTHTGEVAPEHARGVNFVGAPDATLAVGWATYGNLARIRLTRLRVPSATVCHRVVLRFRWAFMVYLTKSCWKVQVPCTPDPHTREWASFTC